MLEMSLQTAGSALFLTKFLNLKQLKSIYHSFLFFLQVFNLDILRESESILYESAWLLYFGVYVKYCKDLGSDRKDIIFK